ncbi:Ldh family oxidoreductase [Tunturiibacter gelidiferens]|uniref:Ldh family oxidoreductase n=1 Tax=Tunturiibacter gelidiferens TaxID=3069689 RepID=UPI003D9B6A33
MLRVPFDQLHAALRRAMQQLGLTEDRAALCARLFAETTRDGVYTHGLNRFPRFVETIRNGSIDIHAEPTKTTGVGAIERWEGHRGVGNLNAHASMQRAIALATQHGIGAVALANTNHWMRGGTYGWQAAEQGLFAICWTNTLANLPAWGATTPTLGNNPLVIAVPAPAVTSYSTWQCRSSPTARSPPTANSENHFPLTAASTPQAI